MPVEAIVVLAAAAATASGSPTPALLLGEAAQAEGQGPALVRLGELLREVLNLRNECWSLMVEQHERLVQYIGAVQARSEALRAAPLRSSLQRLKHAAATCGGGAVGALHDELGGWIEQAVARVELALEQAHHATA